MTHQRFKYREEGINTSKIETVENTKKYFGADSQSLQPRAPVATDVSIHLQCECGLNKWRFICEYSECLECVEWVCMKSKALVLLSVWSPFWSETKYQTRLLNTSEFYFHGACWECIGNLNAGSLGGRTRQRNWEWPRSDVVLHLQNSCSCKCGIGELETSSLTHHLEVVNWVLVFLTSSAESLTSYQQLWGAAQLLC